MNNFCVLIAEHFFSILTVLATSLAACSAWCSYQVSKQSLLFQKSVAKNQNIAMQFNNVLTKLCSLNRMSKNPLKQSDEQFNSLDGVFIEIVDQLEELSDISELDWTVLGVYQCKNKLIINLNDGELDEAIAEIQKQLSALWD